MNTPRWPMQLLSGIALAGAILLFCLPAFLPYQAPPFGSFRAEWLAVLLGLVVMPALIVSPVRMPAMGWGLVAFAGVLGAQLYFTDVAFPVRTAIAIGYALWAAQLVRAGAALRERFGLARLCTWLQIALAAAGFVHAIAALMQGYQLQVAHVVVAPAGRFIGLMAQRNQLADLVSCGLWSLVFLAAYGRVRIVIAALAAAPMLAVLVVAGSRATLVYAAIAFAVLLWRLWYAETDRAGWRALCFALYALMGFGIASALLGGETAARLAAAPGAAANAGDWTRIVLARYAWAMFTERPVLGVGWGEFGYNTLVLAPRLHLAIGNAETYAHNLVLQLAAETGIVGAACILVPLLAWLRRLLTRTLARDEAWLVMIVGFWLFHSLVEFPLWYAYFLGPMALLIGAGAAPAKHSGQFAKLRKFSGMTSAALVPVSVFGIILGLAATAADYRDMRAWLADPRDVRALIQLRRGMYGWRAEGIIAMGTPPGSPDALALTTHALHGLPIPAAVEREAVLLGRAGRRRDAAAIRAAAATLFAH